MHISRLVRVWADIASVGRCKWCQQPLVWRTTFDRGKTLPFNATLTSYGVETDDRGRKIETLAWADAHHCEKRPKNPPRKPPDRWLAPPRQRGMF